MNILRLIFIFTLLCLLAACGGRQVEKHAEDGVKDSTTILLVADSLATTNISPQLVTVEDTLEFNPQAEVALYSKVFEAKTECEYWLVNLTLEKDGELTVGEPYQPVGVDSVLYAYSPLYKAHITITDKRKSKDNVRNIYITREMLNNVYDLGVEILPEFDFVTCNTDSYTEKTINFTCSMTKTGTDWVMNYGCTIGVDYIKIFQSPYPGEYYEEY